MCKMALATNCTNAFRANQVAIKVLADKQLQYAPNFPVGSMQSCRGNLVGGRLGEASTFKNEDVELQAKVYSAEEWKKRVKSLRSNERNESVAVHSTQPALFRNEPRSRWAGGFARFAVLPALSDARHRQLRATATFFFPARKGKARSTPE